MLLLEPITDEAHQLLAEHVKVLTERNGEPIHAIITRGKGQIDRELIDSCPDLQAVARCGVGLDNVDVEEAKARGIQVINTPGANAATMAEHTLSLMLMLMRNMYHSVREVKDSNWTWRNQYSGDELHGKTLGILGMGDIGERTARLAEVFGMKVIYWSRTKKDLPYSYLSLEEVLQQADVLSLHLPSSKQTDGLIGAAELALLKPSAIFINTARGALIDHKALFDALKNDRLAGFAADVLPQEPPTGDWPIIQLPNVLITPHSGSLTASTFSQMCKIAVEKVLDALK
ncbi:2-hydroxyacid dehydrogenase [Albibacterium indicum]|uniref:2-hydroxyacid dehydrogenase n=1 Tax=Albibacterium indicum TaxID=2292082 RepID=UPI0019812703|nr:hydroxyacid dehydrogenase [Pedobacter indicus]